jgi:uncharacterized protein involved in exopolysaccharide biosynthesis
MKDSLEVNPFEDLRKVLSGWNTIVIIAVLFAILGIGLRALLPPIFQASSILQVDVDFQRAAPLDDFTVLKAYERVRGVILADDVLQEAIDKGSNPSVTPEAPTDIRQMRAQIRVSQKPDGWELLVYGRDPQLAASLANAWAETSLQKLEQAYLHALQAWEWQNLLYSAHCRLEPDPMDDDRTLWVCTTVSEELNPDDVTNGLIEAVESTRGILPIFTFSIRQNATPPDTPILWSRGSIVVASTILGLCTGLLWVFRRR